MVGGGAVVQQCYLPALDRLGALQGCAVLEPDARTAGRLRLAWPGVAMREHELHDELSRGDETPPWDAAVVAVPNYLHAAVTELALERGLDVLCEKPLALVPSVCERLGERARQTGRRLAVGMVRRFLPSMRALARALRAGLVGPLRYVQVTHGSAYSWPTESAEPFLPRNGGVLADMGVHYLDLLAHLLGPLVPIGYEDDARGGVEAHCKYRLETNGGLRCTLSSPACTGYATGFR